MSEKQAKFKPLIELYITEGTFYWTDETKNEFREYYYELFLEYFGQSRSCWNNAIKKVWKEIDK